MGEELAKSNGSFRAEYLFGVPVTDKPWAGFFEITCDLAREIIRFQGENRQLRKHVVKKFANLIRSGRFGLTHQGIAFNVLGVLIDGQHRLNACVETGRSIFVLVAFNMPEESYLRVDRGTNRSAGDDLITMGLETTTAQGNRFAAAARVVAAVDKGFDPTLSDTGSFAETFEMPGIKERHPKLADTVGWARLVLARSSVKYPPAGFAGLLTLMREVDDRKAMGLAERMTIGVPRSVEDPANLIRNAQAAGRGKSTAGAARAAFMYRFVRAWNHEHAGTTATRLHSGNEGSGFPDIAGYKGK
jgi:hypothetical protein